VSSNRPGFVADSSRADAIARSEPPSQLGSNRAQNTPEMNQNAPQLKKNTKITADLSK
jgi:hypothetical protein